MLARQPAEAMHKSNTMEDDAPLGHTSNPSPKPVNPPTEEVFVVNPPPQQKAQSTPL